MPNSGKSIYLFAEAADVLSGVTRAHAPRLQSTWPHARQRGRERGRTVEIELTGKVKR
jgi:hypothetical protein